MSPLPARLLALTTFAAVSAGAVAVADPAEPARPAPASPAAAASAADAGLEQFLDRLMLVESDGRDLLRNPRSTAVGPFQFIEATFLEVVKRNFASEIAGRSDQQVLALRTDRAFARKAAAAYTRENAGRLADAGITPSFAHLRLAYLVGPAAALRVARLPPATPVALVLGPAALKANPFLARYSTADLLAKAARDVSADPRAAAGIAVVGRKKAAATVVPTCSLTQASCRKWLALAERRFARGQ